MPEIQKMALAVLIFSEGFDVCVDTHASSLLLPGRYYFQTYKNCNSTSKINDEKTKREQPSLFTKHKPLLVFS